MQSNHTTTTTADRRARINVEAARRNCPRNDARLDGQDEFQRQVDESLAFMDFQAQGYSWVQSMKLASEAVSARYAKLA